MKSYVFYDDTDCGGIVYHANYIKFCERARSLIFFENNCLPQSESEGFVVANIESKFITPLKFGDFYHVTTKIIECKNTSITLLQEIYKISSAGSCLTNRGNGARVWMDCVTRDAINNNQNNKTNKLQDSINEDSKITQSLFVDSKNHPSMQNKNAELDSNPPSILTFKATIKLAYLDFKAQKIKKIPEHLMQIINEFY